ncbi:hypothetical protein I4U23_013612 [Adineta vaga]|nr:hypothetical protein I4U23_013612 [Adineta vaga]
MFIRKQFRRHQQKITSIYSNKNDSWKVRPIYGFEKYLFPNQITSIKPKRIVHIDPARFIYPRDAMGNLLHPISNRTHSTFIPFYLPKFDAILPHSPAWTIKNVYDTKPNIDHIGPMTYDSINDKSQLSCKFGWTQIGRHADDIRIGLTVPFYDTRKYNAIGNPCSHAVIIGKRQLEICNYSGYKIYPGHGTYYLNSKCQRSADMRRNPRRVTWTVYYRRKHKKGAAEQETKKRTRRTVKFQRAITGVTWNEILAKRNQQPEFRKAQRQDAINAAKIAKKAKSQQKKVAQPAGAKAGKPVKKPEKIQKNVPKAGPKKGTQR